MKEIKITIKILQIINILIMLFSLYFRGIFNKHYYKEIILYFFTIFISFVSIKNDKKLFYLIQITNCIILFKYEIKEKKNDLNSDDKDEFNILLNFFMLFTSNNVNDSNDSAKYLFKELKFFIFYFFCFFNSICCLFFNILNYYLDKNITKKKTKKIKND
jgi:hypothetical protein